MKTAVRLNSITKLYGNLIAVDNLDLNVIECEILGLIGPNGASK